MILHLFFTVILTIAVYLLASLISKNILQVTDIGTDDFLIRLLYQMHGAEMQ